MRYARTQAELHKWHTAALADPDISRHEGDPQPGWYKMRRVAKGPWVPVHIWIKQTIENGELADDESLCCQVDGLDKNPVPIWTHLKPISEREFYQIHENRLHIPGMLDDAKPVDLTATPIFP